MKTLPRLAKVCALAASLGLLSLQAHASGDAGLYGPGAPKGSAFLRVFNASNAEVNVSVGSAAISDVNPLAASNFSFLPGGDYSAKVGTQTLPVKLAADHYYSLVSFTSGPPQLVEEPPFKNKEKALVRVQNLSDRALTLKTTDGKTEVIKAVAAKGEGEREINPVKISFGLFDGDQKVKDLPPIALDRGEAAVLFVTGSGGSLEPVWIKHAISVN